MAADLEARFKTLQDRVNTEGTRWRAAVAAVGVAAAVALSGAVVPLANSISATDTNVAALQTSVTSLEAKIAKLETAGLSLGEVNAETGAPQKSRFDLPPEPYAMNIGGVNGIGARVWATDPLTGKTVPVAILEEAADHLRIKMNVTDSPRLLHIEEADGAVPPPGSFTQGPLEPINE